MIPSHSFSTSISLQTDAKTDTGCQKKKTGYTAHVKGKATLKNKLKVIHMDKQYGCTNNNINKAN